MNSSTINTMPCFSVRLAGAALILMQAGAAVIPAHAADPLSPHPVRFTLSADRLTRDAYPISGEASESDWEPLPSGARARSGNVIRYTLQIENCGSRPVKGIVVTQPVPPGMAYILTTARCSVPTTTVSYLTLHDGQRYSERPVVTKLSSAVYEAALAPASAADALAESNSAAAASRWVDVERIGHVGADPRQEPAPAESYRQVRWTFNEPLPPRSAAWLSYQVRVK